jgi:hypothetical protein
MLAGCETLGLTKSSDVATNPADAMVPACPPTAILAGAEQVTKLRPGAPMPAVQSTDNAVLTAQLAPAQLDCDYDRDKNTLSVDVSFAVRIARGPAASGALPPLDYFIAVIDSDGNVVTKRAFQNPADLGGAMTATLSQNVAHFAVPLGKDKRPSDYEILTGFQLTASELAYNRLPKPLPAARTQAGP